MLDFNLVPSWVIEKRYGRGNVNTAACILALQSGSAAVIKETPKAYLIEWDNTELYSGCAGGQLWVAKSLIN